MGLYLRFKKNPNIIQKWFELSQIFRNNNVFFFLCKLMFRTRIIYIYVLLRYRGCWVAWGGLGQRLELEFGIIL